MSRAREIYKSANRASRWRDLCATRSIYVLAFLRDIGNKRVLAVFNTLADLCLLLARGTSLPWQASVLEVYRRNTTGETGGVQIKVLFRSASLAGDLPRPATLHRAVRYASLLTK